MWKSSSWVLLGTLALPVLAQTQTKLRVVELSLDNERGRTVAVYEDSRGSLFVEADELASLGLVTEALSRVPVAQIEGCARCVPLARIGSYSEDPATTRAQLVANAEFQPPRSYSIGDAPAESVFQDFRREPGLHFGFGALGNYSRSASADSLLDTHGGAIEANWSWGKAGTLRTGGLFRGREETLLLNTYWEQHFLSNATTLRIGDSFTGSDILGGFARITGVHWQSNFDVRPSLLTQPEYEFSFQSRVPGTVEIFRDGVLAGRQDFESGTVTLEQLPPSVNGDVRLVIRNSLGEEQVIYAPFFGDAAQLRKGLARWSVSAGALRDSNQVLKDQKAASFNVTYGLSNRTNLIASGGYTEAVQTAAVGTRFLTSFGRLTFQAGGFFTDPGVDRVGVVVLQNNWAMNPGELRAGVSVVHTDSDYREGDGATIYNAFTSFSSGRLFGSLSTSGVDNRSSAAASVGTRLGRFSLSISGTVQDDQEAVYSAQLRFSPRLAANPVFGVAANSNQEGDLARLTSSISIAEAGYSAQALASARRQGNSAPSEFEDGQLRLGVSGNSGELALDGARVGEAERYSYSLSGSLVVDGDGAFLLPRIPVNGGYSIVQTDFAGTEIRRGNKRFVTGPRGRVALPELAYVPIEVDVLPGSLPSGAVLPDVPSARLFPGQKTTIDLRDKANQDALLLVLPREIGLIDVNGESVIVAGQRVLITGLKPGGNILTIEGRQYFLAYNAKQPYRGALYVDEYAQRIVSDRP